MSDRATLANDGTLIFWCKGCEEPHGVPTRGSHAWSWNGSKEWPTLTPSILVHSHPRHEAPDHPRCHSFVSNGRIQYLEDCTHALRNQTIDIPEWSTT